MKSRETPRSIRQGMSVQQIGTETLVYDERRHLAFCLNESSSVIWRLADGEHTIAAIREAASAELKTQLSEDFVLYALGELRRDGLVETSEVDSRATISRRAVLQKLGVGGALLRHANAPIVALTAVQAYTGAFRLLECLLAARPAGKERKPRALPWYITMTFGRSITGTESSQHAVSGGFMDAALRGGRRSCRAIGMRSAGARCPRVRRAARGC